LFKKKKYIVILIDGAADYRLAELGNRTPLQVSRKPVIDYLARNGIIGMVKTIPQGMSPGSDTANLAILGYDPRIYSSGRSSLEAVSIGVNLSENDTTFRCNLVTLSDEEDYMSRIMVDYSAGEITTEEARILILDIAEKLETEDIKFYPGVSYRHVIVWKNIQNDNKDSKSSKYSKYSKDSIGQNEKSVEDDFKLTPPHDISGRKIKDYLPCGRYSDVILNLMVGSSKLLMDHPVNKKRIKDGKRQANSTWIWGKGKKPALESFYKKYGINGSVISAVDLIKGIGICAGLKPVNVEGATGNIHTNFLGKANAVISEIRAGQDFVYLHIEAPDECSHQGNINDKIRAIEIIDEKVVKTVKEALDEMDIDYRLMILPDHPTPIVKKTHTSEPVPFLIFKSRNIKEKPLQIYDEFYPVNNGVFIKEGYKLMDYFFDLSS